MYILRSFSSVTQRLNYIPVCKLYIPRSINRIHDFKFPFQYMKDDLLIPPVQLENGVVKRMVKEIRDNPEAEVHYKGIGLLMYHTGKQQIYDPLLIERFEQNLFKLAFGAFHGFINLSINNFYMQEFFEKEFIRNKDSIECREAVEMIEAIINNKSLTKEYMRGLIKDTLQPILLKQYNKQLKYNVGLQIRLVLALCKFQYFEKELFGLVLNELIGSKKIRQLPTWLSIRDALVGIKDKLDLTQQINKINENLQKRADFTWIYNFQENRYFTIQEMIAKRENYTHPEQRIGFYQRNKEMQESYQKSKFIDYSDKEKKLSEQEQDAELKRLLYDQYVKAKLGDIDSKELVKNDEINAFFSKKQDTDIEGMLNKVEISDQDLIIDEEDEVEENNQKKIQKKQFKKRKGRQGVVADQMNQIRDEDKN